MPNYTTNREHDNKRVQDALNARRNRKAFSDPSTPNKNRKVEVALTAREKRVQSSLPSVFSDINSRMTAEIDAYNGTKPSYGTYDDTYKSQRDRRLEISRLRGTVKAYSKYMKDGVADDLLSRLDLMESGYDVYLAMSNYASENEYNKAVEQAKADQARWTELTAGYDPAKNQQEGKSGWDEYVARQKQLAQEAEERRKAEEEEGYSWEKFWEDLGRWMGPGSNPDTSLPFYVDTQLIAQGYRNEESAKRVPNELTWTEEQREIYGFLWKRDKGKAEEFAYAVNNMLNAQHEKEQIQRIQEWSTDNFVSGAIATVGAIVASPAGLADYLGDVIASGTLGYIPESDGDISPFEYSQAVTSGVGQHLNKEYGTLDEDIPVIGGKGWGDVYGLGVSVAESSLAAFTGGPAQALITSLGSAAAAGVDDAVNRGATGEQAIAYGTMVGIAEGLAEKIGVDNLMKIGTSATVKQLVWNLLKQGAAEGIEEGVTSVVNNFADNLIMADKSNFNILVAEYMGKGLSEEEAKKKAWMDMSEDIAFDILGGFASGAAHAGPKTTISYAQTQNQYRETGKTIMGADGGVDALMNLANEVAGVTSPDMNAALTEKASKVSQKTTPRNVGKLYNTVQTANNYANAPANQADIVKSLERNGFTTETAKDIAEALVANQNGQELTKAQKKLIESVRYNEDVRNAVANIMDNPKSTMGQRSQNIRDFEKDIVHKRLSKLVAETTPEENSTPDTSTPVAETAVSVPSEVSEPTVTTIDSNTYLKDAPDTPVKIKEVASIKDGKMTLRLEDGREVDAADVTHGSETEAMIYSAVASLEGLISPRVATKMINHLLDLAAQGEGISDVFVNGVAQAYQYGYMGYHKDSINAEGTLASMLTQRQRNIAYGNGKMQRAENDAARKKAPAENKKTAETSGKKAKEKADTEAPDGKSETKPTQREAQKKANAALSKKGVVFSGYDGKRLDTSKLSQHQRVGVSFAQRMSKKFGMTFYFYRSYMKDGVRVYKDRNGKVVKAENGFCDPSDRSIHIDLNAGSFGRGTVLFTISHELVHFMKDTSPQHFEKLADLLVKGYAKQGQSVDDLIALQQAEAEENGRSLTHEEAFEEVVADSMEEILADGRVLELMQILEAEDHSFAGKVKKFFQDIMQLLKETIRVYSNFAPDSREGNMVRDMRDIYAQLQEIFAEGIYEGGKNHGKMGEKENTTGEGGVKYQAKRGEVANYKQPITMEDISILRSIGRKSINQFNPEDLKKAEKWAYKFYQELGVKSPFFRSWFGDWRMFDKTPISIVKIPNAKVSVDAFKTFVNQQRGIVVNMDTKGESGPGWEIRISGNGERNTIAHSGGAGLSVDALTAIRGLIENSTLLDTEVHEHHSNNSKTPATDRIAFDHKLYALGMDPDGSVALYKITVEEIFQDPKHPHDKRFHNLKYIEKVADSIPGLTYADLHSADTVRDKSTTIYKVADLYGFVKQYDTEFQPNPVSGVVNPDGTPKIMYHGTSTVNGDFYIFDETKAIRKGGLGLKALGKGNYFTSKRLDGTERYGNRVISVFLNIRNPFVYDGGISFSEYATTTLGIASNSTYDEIQQEMRRQRYDGVIQHDKNGEIAIAVTFDSEQIKSATDNIGTFDGTNPDIRYSTRKGETTSYTPRSLLANADESVAQTPIQQKALKEYRELIGKLQMEETQLKEDQQQLEAIQDRKGQEAKRQQLELRRQIIATKDRIAKIKKELVRYEGYVPIKDMVTRERKRVVQAQLADYREKYGTIKAGENKVRDDSLPISTDGKNKVSLTARTVKGAKTTTDELADLIDEQVADGKLTYLPITNNATTKAAREKIERDGWDRTLEKWKSKVSNGHVSAELTATGAILLNNAAQNGDKKTWLDILYHYQLMGTSAGQAIQAMRILKQLTPEDKLYLMKRSVEQLIQDTNIKFSVDDIMGKIDPDIIELYKQAETYEEEDWAIREIGATIAQYVPSTFMDKFTALRYLNMLGNPRTQIRNIAGNTAMGLVATLKNATAMGIEQIVYKASGGKFQRTKAFASPAMVKAAAEDFKIVKSMVLGGGKYSDSSWASSELAQAVRDNQRIFKRKLLEKYRGATNWAMDQGDLIFSKVAYANALAGYLRANGIKDSDFSKVDAALMDAARIYAVKEAQEATFRDTNVLSGWISKVGRRSDTPGAVKAISEGVLPFRKTPANILVRAEEYSPLGFVNALYRMTKKAASTTKLTDKGNVIGAFARGGEMISGADIVNSLAKGLTGTGLFFLGMWLGSMGILVGGAEDDEDLEYFQQMNGQQNYALKIGDTYITIDFLSPAAIPMFVGAQIQKLSEDGGVELKDWEGALTSIADPLVEMSMLQGVSDTLDNIRFSENNTLQLVVSAAANYMTQGLTNSWLGQAERGFEDARQTTYVDGNSALPSWMQRTLGKASAKTPIWDYHQIPYINAWGEEETNPAVPANMAYNMLSTSYVSTETVDNVSQELTRLNEAQDDVNVFPGTPDREYNNEPLSAEKYVALAKAQGQTQRKIVEGLVGSEMYAGLTDTYKAKAISYAYTYAKESAQIEVMGRSGFSSKWMGKIEGDVAEGILAHIMSDKDTVPAMIREREPRIKKAAEAKAAGDTDTYLEIVEEIVDEGHFKWKDVSEAVKDEVKEMSE